MTFMFQLLRKRHIGNDIVTIVFQEPGSLPFTPKYTRSHFQHVFVIVRAIDPCSDNTRYRLVLRIGILVNRGTGGSTGTGAAEIRQTRYRYRYGTAENRENMYC